MKSRSNRQSSLKESKIVRKKFSVFTHVVTTFSALYCFVEIFIFHLLLFLAIISSNFFSVPPPHFLDSYYIRLLEVPKFTDDAFSILEVLFLSLYFILDNFY